MAMTVLEKVINFSVIFNTSAHTAQPTPASEQPEKQSPKDQLKLIRETVLYEGDDPYAEKIVERPQKGRLWGFEGELVRQRDVYFNSADSVTLERLVTFLEVNLVPQMLAKLNQRHCGARSHGVWT